MLVCGYLAVVVLAITMLPGLRYAGSAWTGLILGGVVVVSGWPFHRAAPSPPGTI